jgi:hypothetical protein
MALHYLAIGENPMNQLEQNIVESFRLAKNDIMKIQEKIAELSANQERMMEWISDTRDKQVDLTEKVKARPVKADAAVVTAKRTKHVYVSSKTGKKVHIESCPFAKNIKPKSRVYFASKTKALNKGLKPCECMKRI